MESQDREQSPDTAWSKLGGQPGLCLNCQHAKINETRRGTAYLRCTRSAWDVRLVRYPRLPVRDCVGFDAENRNENMKSGEKRQQ
jgi:hypothetical protein